MVDCSFRLCFPAAGLLGELLLVLLHVALARADVASLIGAQAVVLPGDAAGESAAMSHLTKSIPNAERGGSIPT